MKIWGYSCWIPAYFLTNRIYRLFLWKIHGRQSIYENRLKAATSQRRFEETLRDISDSFTLQHTRNLGLLRIRFYRLIVDNDMHIVQRIAHDIKNRLHHINLQLDNTEGDAHAFENCRSHIASSIREMYEKTTMLSDFSRINLLHMEPVDLVSLVDEVVLSYSGHPRFSDVSYKVRGDHRACRQ